MLFTSGIKAVMKNEVGVWGFERSGKDEKANVLNQYIGEQSSSDAT